MPTLGDRIKSAWNAFKGRDPTSAMGGYELGYSTSYRPDRYKLTHGNDRTIISTIYTRIAIDASQVRIEHGRKDQNGRYVDTITSGLNYCLTVSANTDQTGRAFMQDVVMSMLDEGVVAIVPVDTDVNPYNTESFDIRTLRVGKVVQWYPEHVKINLYNERTGQKEDITLPKRMVALPENPFYAAMNEPNSTMQRLRRRLGQLDRISERTSSGSLDLIVQLPYVVKSEARKLEAERRRQLIEDQLTNTKYGVAYTDGTEKIVQLNRPLENNLMKEVEYLTSMLYSQLGMPQSVFDGTADEATMLNYNSRTILPIVGAIAEEMERKFLTKTARTQGQHIVYFTEPFKLVPVNQIAEIADKFTRNEILSSNELRQVIGFKPVNDPAADELRNANLNKAEGQHFANTGEGSYDEGYEEDVDLENY